MRNFSFFDLFALELHFFSQSPQRLMNEILHRNIPVWGIKNGDGFVSVRILPVRRGYFHAFRKTLTDEERWEERPCGLLHLLILFRKRLGFFAGVLFLALTLFYSTDYLWGVDVEGNDRIPAFQIRSQLESYGLVPGKRLSELRAKEIALRFDTEHPEFDYVGINVVGSRARVEVREHEKEPEPFAGYEGSSNLVARIYGKIVRYEVLSGQIAVKRGDSVTEGALLISGVSETKNGSFYPVRAAGRVFAETQREFSVTVPFEEVSRVYSPKTKAKKSYEILGASFPPLARKTDGERVLEFTEPLTLFGYVLPVIERERLFLVPVEKKTVINVDRAEKLAYDKYEQFKRGTFAESDEILSENLSVTTDENGVTLTAQIVAVENICREAPFRFTSEN